VTEYYGAKKDILGEHQRNAELKKDSVTPLYPSMNEPSAETVGFLIDLQCGHTQKPSDVEATMITQHLAEADFL
jgi:hypothetical protein